MKIASYLLSLLLGIAWVSNVYAQEEPSRIETSCTNIDRILSQTTDNGHADYDVETDKCTIYYGNGDVVVQEEGKEDYIIKEGNSEDN